MSQNLITKNFGWGNITFNMQVKINVINLLCMLDKNFKGSYSFDDMLRFHEIYQYFQFSSKLVQRAIYSIEIKSFTI